MAKALVTSIHKKLMALAQAVFEFVLARKAKMPRTALRYTIEKMPEQLRKEAMAK